MKLYEAILSGKPFKLPEHEYWILVKDGNFVSEYEEYSIYIKPEDMTRKDWVILQQKFKGSGLAIDDAIKSSKPFKLPEHEDWIIVEDGYFKSLATKRNISILPSEVIRKDWIIKEELMDVENNLILFLQNRNMKF